MRVSEFTNNSKLPTVQELHKRANVITQQIIDNNELKLVTNDNLDTILKKYI